MIEKKYLEEKYLKQGHSSREISKELGCSERKVDYWLRKHEINKRSISEAIYVKSNPTGNPFCCKPITKGEQWFLLGLGLGLYWGEGTKSNKYSVRLGNSDPMLIKTFIYFLEDIYAIETKKLKFGLQIFSDMSEEKALNFWISSLKVSKSQFQKVVITPERGIGNYRNKTKYGVLTVHFNNKKLRDIIVDAITQLQTTSYANVAQSVEHSHGESHDSL